MTAQIIHKIIVGDPLSDDELNAAISFYGQMEAGLRLLGPKYHLAWAEVQRTYSSLQLYRINRDNPF